MDREWSAVQCLLGTPNPSLWLRWLLGEGFLENVMPDTKLKEQVGVTSVKQGGVIGIPGTSDSRSVLIKVR